MKRWQAVLLALLYGAAGVFMIGQMTHIQGLQATKSIELEILSPREFQALLNELEPDSPIVVDGIIGPESLGKWSRVYCNQQAMKTFKKGNL